MLFVVKTDWINKRCRSFSAFAASFASCLRGTRIPDRLRPASGFRILDNSSIIPSSCRALQALPAYGSRRILSNLLTLYLSLSVGSSSMSEAIIM